jgi:ketosteroid isomerase-like protein
MRHGNILALVLAVSGPGTVAAQAAPSVAGTLPAAELKALEAIRKDVWVNWFTGDTAALRRVLPPELVAISPDGSPWQTLEQTLAGSVEFKAAGNRFISVAFEGTTVHRLDAVVVMFSTYAVVTERAGQRNTQRGRATEVFVRKDGRWVHTSWHLDIAP